MNGFLLAVLLSLSMLLAQGCGRGQAADEDRVRGPSHEPVAERIARAVPQDPSGGLSSEKHLADTRQIPARRFDGVPAFYIAARRAELRRFPCRECHTEPLERLKARKRTEKNAHWEIELRHAGEQTMACATCHAGGNMESLKMLNGQPVEFDHAYEVCGQCHSGQAKDWTGGAHGKRLGGWAPPRVISNCTACHNPHQPKLEKRWPSRSSRLLTARE